MLSGNSSVETCDLGDSDRDDDVAEEQQQSRAGSQKYARTCEPDERPTADDSASGDDDAEDGEKRDVGRMDVSPILRFRRQKRGKEEREDRSSTAEAQSNERQI